MSEDETLLARGDYVGATADELRRRTSADKMAGVVSQKALFLRRGKVSLHEDRLVLGAWGEAGDLVLRRADITSVEVRFTDLYGRFIGGLLNAGKPLILGTVPAGEVYLLIDRKEFMETTDDRAWAARIEAWLSR
ncbi:hypothetical protein [Streptomyces sp. 3214.6]|uniref:hypothetical protein n=1 Tax=Streptomyces sp. 3214.6 TaxID=1882757 RepID=UPI00090A291D|nr:hypothetical protein [Streptomyces sp. 3214.6]SHI16840.1 hypothetical protein SAMN05444521_4738 [Streptomyces sp. 3214.6]